MVVFIQYACYYGFLNFKTNAFDLFSFGSNLFKHQSRRFPLDVQPRILYFYFKCRLGIWMNIHIIFTTTLILHSSTVTYWRFLIKLWSSMSARMKNLSRSTFTLRTTWIIIGIFKGTAAALLLLCKSNDEERKLNHFGCKEIRRRPQVVVVWFAWLARPTNFLP